MGPARLAATAIALLALAPAIAGCGDDTSSASSAPSAITATAANGASPSGIVDGDPAARGGPRLNPLTPTDPGRVGAANAAAIAALGRIASQDDPPNHDHGDLGGLTGPQQMLPMWVVDQHSFDAQWAAAVASVGRYDSVEKAEALGYQPAAVQSPGIGVHLVNWTLIDQPFDPAHPSMLLFDERPGRDSTLVGYSYWVRSTTEPEGFAGPNDQWHQHKGLCVVNGWIDREESVPGECAGLRLAGSDLWMLHAWVVPGWSDRWGPFATINPKLCPSVRAPSGTAACNP